MPKRRYYTPEKNSADETRLTPKEYSNGEMNKIIKLQQFWKKHSGDIKSASLRKMAAQRKELIQSLTEGKVLILSATAAKNLPNLKELNKKYDAIIQDWWFAQRVHVYCAWIDPTVDDSELKEIRDELNGWEGDQEVPERIANFIQVSDVPLSATRKRENQRLEVVTKSIARDDRLRITEWQKFTDFLVEGRSLPSELVTREKISKANQKMCEEIKTAYDTQGFFYSFKRDEPNSGCCQYSIAKIFRIMGIDPEQVELPEHTIVTTFEK